MEKQTWIPKPNEIVEFSGKRFKLISCSFGGNKCKIEKMDLPYKGKILTEIDITDLKSMQEQNETYSLLPFSKDKEIGLYEKFLDGFTNKDGVMKRCNPDAIFNFFANNVWR